MKTEIPVTEKPAVVLTGGYVPARIIKFRVFAFNRMLLVKQVNEYLSIDSNGTLNSRNYPKDSVAMQFTGLLDKNGKEIYEGDIMPVGNDFEIVKWSGTEACYFLGTLILSASASHRQVIGNVFENAMLLES